MNPPPQPPSLAAEFIAEDPGKPIPQRPARRRGLESLKKWVKNWMKKLPQGDEDWDNNIPSTPEDIQRLRSRLTISHIGSRRDMDWVTLLETYAASAKDFEGREAQLHAMVMVAACQVAYSHGLSKEDMHAVMAKCVTGGSDTLRSKRFALPKSIKISDELANVLGARAYELPLRGRLSRMLAQSINTRSSSSQHAT
ncbi:hypothetical protein F66182_4060 [Fusarium sp. NRRL 66182]|nr:hypothetical protein F66182_4060 [Fusarium sp. NRRL 66182]